MARDPKRARVRLNVISHHNKHKIKKGPKAFFLVCWFFLGFKIGLGRH